MKKEYDALFTPWKIRDVEFKNRIVLCPMGGTTMTGWLEPNHFDREAANFHLERAKNNVGLLIPGIAPIKDTMGGKWLYKGEKKFIQLRDYMDEFHRTGAKMFIQLTAGMGRSMAVSDLMSKIATNKLLGFLGKPLLDVDHLTMAPSDLPNRWADAVPSRAMLVEEIHEMIEAFARTAVLLRDANVDGIEIHAVHEGYLLDQFTMKYTNLRTDEYGGSFENRYRFPVEIVQAIKKACGEDFPVSLRYSVVSKTKGFRQGAVPGEEYVEVGRDMEESERAAKYLQDAGYDMLNCDNGTYDAWYWAHPPAYMPLNCNLDYVAHIKKFVDIPVVCAGRMTPKDGAAAVADGRIDAVGIGRQFLTDGEWVTKLMEDREEDIKPCICCHNGCFNFSKWEGTNNTQALSDSMGLSRCALNPTTMQTRKYKIVPTAAPKKVGIVGGGIGGMEAAIVLKKRGHSPVIYEKTETLGGVFIAAAAPEFKEKDRALVEWYRREIDKCGIEVKLNTEVRDLSEMQADVVVIATGAVPNNLPFRGIEHTVEAIDYLLGHKVGENVTIIGGGLTGCEIALDLVRKGKKPTVIEMKNDLIAADGVCLANSSYLREYLPFAGVPIHLNTTVAEVRENGVVAKGKSGDEFFVEADDVIVSIGYRPNPLVGKAGKVHLIGDAHTVGNLRTVIWRAWDVCMKI